MLQHCAVLYSIEVVTLNDEAVGGQRWGLPGRLALKALLHPKIDMKVFCAVALWAALEKARKT